MNSLASPYNYAHFQNLSAGNYFSFTHVLNQLKSVEQCKTQLEITEYKLRNLRHHHPWSYIKKHLSNT